MKIKIKQKVSFAAFIIGAFFVLASRTNSASLNDVVINEIAWMGTNVSATDEWIELYNNTDENINLEGWGLYEAGGETIIEPLIGIINAKSYYLVERTNDYTLPDIEASQPPTGWGGYGLHDSGEHLQLLNNNSNIIDEVDYTSDGWFAGDQDTKQTMERKNPLNSGNNPDNWQTSSEEGGTPKAPNSNGAETQAEEESQAQEDASSGATGSSPTTSSAQTPTTTDATTPSGDPAKVRITEIFPNPEGSEDQEFIELWNNQDKSISIHGWKLSDASKVITLKDITLVPGEYRAIYRTTTKIALNNSSETIYLYDSNGNLVASHEYSSTIEGYSLSYDINQNKFLWSSTKTPSKSNEFTTPNEAPNAVIAFSNNPVAPNEKIIISAADSTDPDDDALSYFWEIGKNFQASGMVLKHKFEELGRHLITLSINDGLHEATATSVIDVIPANDILSLRRQRQDASRISDAISDSGANRADAIHLVADGQIFITEIFPNPAGRDDNEWIELYNPNDFDISLDGWIIDDQDGGSRPHTISDRVIGAKSYLILGKEETKLTLNNSSDEARLFNKDEKLIDEALYDDVQENESYSKSDDGFWFWTPSATAGKQNSSGNEQDAYNFTGPATINNDYLLMEDAVDIDLPNIRELEIGTQVRVQGTVAVEPGVLGKTYFYITGSPGIQIYFYKKDWPILSVGDVVGVIGELTESNNEMRLKVSAKEDIVPLYASDPPEPDDEQTGAIGEFLEGALIELSGQLIEKSGANWYIDDGSGEAKITFQPSANIQKPAAKTGDWLKVVGLVSETKSGYRVMPRYQDDIRIMPEEPPSPDEQGEVLGDYSSSGMVQRFRIPANNKPNEILKYLLITSSALIILLAALLIKLKTETRKRIKELEKNK